MKMKVDGLRQGEETSRLCERIKCRKLIHHRGTESTEFGRENAWTGLWQVACINPYNKNAKVQTINAVIAV